MYHYNGAMEQITEESLKMVRDQVLVVTEKGESETDAGIVISASVRQPYPMCRCRVYIPCAICLYCDRNNENNFVSLRMMENGDARSLRMMPVPSCSGQRTTEALKDIGDENFWLTYCIP